MTVPYEPVLDAAVIASLRELDDDPAFLAELIDGFLGDAAGRMEALSLASRAGDAPAAVAVAHALKGAARALGLVRLGNRAAAIELEARAGSAPGGSALQAVREELAAAGQALATVRGGG